MNTEMNIGILTGCESDKHLSEQIFKELNELKSSNFINPIYIYLSQNNIVDSYFKANYCFKQFKYEFILAVGDRTEQIGGVLAAFQNNIKIGHLYSGDYNTIATYDDKHRHAITLYSDIQLCSCKESMENTIRLMRSAGLVPNANLVGATHFNGIDIKSLPKFELNLEKPYVLILINSETLGNDENIIEDVITEYMKLCTNSTPNVIIAKGNGDNEKIEKIIHYEISSKVNTDMEINMLSRLSHKYFIYLLLNCDTFITNSSVSIYEAPYLIHEDKIIHIGNRNKNRTKIPLTSHDGFASSRVANLIKTFLETKL